MRTEQENIKLANLLYPDVKHTMEEYLAMYPKRKLPEGAEVTRVAPSPTGFFHMGSVYQSVLDKTIADKSNGVFYLRIEDTDTKREVKDAGEIAYEMLCKMELIPNEGYCGVDAEIGEYGPYVQSKRIDIYQAFAKKLVELGRAFPCFCKKSENKEDVLKRREEELEESLDIEGHDVCRDLSFSQIEKNLEQNKPWALRLYSIGNPDKTFKIKDKIKGERELHENNKDIVIMKSDGIPPYALAHLVDDTLMGTTTVVRGEEWFPSLPAHIELFKAIGFKPLRYAHTPVICKLDENGNKRKLSKRKDPEADTRFFISEGYPVNGVKEYLINLLNSDFEMWRMQNPTKPLKDFDLTFAKVGSNSPMFDMIKLADVCKNVISKMSADAVYSQTLKWSYEFDMEFANILDNDCVYSRKVLNIDREKPRPRKDIAKWSDVPKLLFYMFNELFWSRIRGLEFPENIKEEDTKALLLDYATNLKLFKTNMEWFEDLKKLAERNDFASDMKAYKANPEAYKGNISDVSTIIRVAITTKQQSPDLFEIINLLGYDETKKRLIYAIKGKMD